MLLRSHEHPIKRQGGIGRNSFRCIPPTLAIRGAEMTTVILAVILCVHMWLHTFSPVDQIWPVHLKTILFPQCVKLATCLICLAKGSVFFFLSKSREDFFALWTACAFNVEGVKSRNMFDTLQWHFMTFRCWSMCFQWPGRLALQVPVGWTKRRFVGLQLGQLEFWKKKSHTSRSSSCPTSNLWTVPLLQYGATAVLLSRIRCLQYVSSSSSQTKKDRKKR